MILNNIYIKLDKAIIPIDLPSVIFKFSKKLILISLILFNIVCYCEGWDVIFNPVSFGINKITLQYTTTNHKPSIYAQIGCNITGFYHWCSVNSASNLYYRINLLNNNSYIPFGNFIKSQYCQFTIGGNSACYCQPLDFFIVSPLDSNFLIKYYDWECYTTNIKKTSISYDGGVNFNEIFANMSLNGCIINPSNDSILCLSANEVVYRSTNRGLNWIAGENYADFMRIQSGGYFYLNPALPQYLFARGNNNMYVSTNFGISFSSISVPSFKSMVVGQNTIFGLDSDKVYYTENPLGAWYNNTNNIKANCLEVSKENNNILYAGTNLGLYKSTNKGQAWFLYNNSFDTSIIVKYLIKPADSEDTIICATNRKVYKVYASHIIDTNLVPVEPPELVYPPDSTIGILSTTKLIWKKALHATRYNLVVRKQSSNGDIIKDIITTDTSYNLINLLPLTFYYWQVRAMNNAGNSDFSSFRKFKTCGQPYEVSLISPVNNASINLPAAFICSKAKSYIIDNLLDTTFIYSFHFVKDTNLYTGEFSRDIYDTILIIDSLAVNTKYYWHVRAINLYGTSLFTPWRSFTISPIGIQRISENIPKEYKLKNNYPNPFNPVTKIQFDLPRNSKVSIIIYNSLGQNAETILNNYVEAGEYEIFWNGGIYPSGVYYYQLNAENYSDTKKMVLIK